MKLLLILVLALPLMAQDTPPSMLPVHAGVSILVMGQYADWATIWKQPELNPLLGDQAGPYTGRLYHTGTYRKIGLTMGLITTSYVASWVWPKHRKWIGMATAIVGY